jgi:tRNA(adenine34) deaminase
MCSTNRNQCGADVTLIDHTFYMRAAIAEAKQAAEMLEVPIGAVVVYEGEIIGRGHNLRETTHSPTAHAEILAIQQAAQHLGDWRLEGCRLYVTLEPCPMCAGAILLSRIKHLIFGTPDPKAGCVGTMMNLLQDPRFNHQSQVTSGVLQEECASLLQDFFRQLRQQKKKIRAHQE